MKADRESPMVSTLNTVSIVLLNLSTVPSFHNQNLKITESVAGRIAQWFRYLAVESEVGSAVLHCDSL